MKNDGYTCQDIDECSEKENMCKTLCKNTYGSYKCACKPGYKLHTDSRSCVGE